MAASGSNYVHFENNTDAAFQNQIWKLRMMKLYLEVKKASFEVILWSLTLVEKLALQLPAT